jgi:hypothetical protein
VVLNSAVLGRHRARCATWLRQRQTSTEEAVA